jgi:ADP-heptose:LPS heptosyltransferase
MKMNSCLTLAERLQAGIEHHQENRLPQAVEMYARVLEIDPDNAAALHLLGLAAHQLGRFEEALKLVDCAVTRRPEIADFHNSRGVILAALGRIEEALRAFQNALDLDPHHQDAEQNRAHLVKQSSTFSEAAPYRRAQLHAGREGTLGDVLLCTPALREVKRLNPNCRIIFYTRSPELVKGLPFLDEVKDYDERPLGTIEMRYEHCLPPQRHLASILGECLGVSPRDTRPSCVIDPEIVEQFRRRFQGLRRPCVLVNRHAGSRTPNKEWPDEHWNELIERVSQWATIVEIGRSARGSYPLPSGSYLSLRDKTSLPELMAVIAAGDLLISPVSAPLHIAAAAGVPSVVIYGGYAHPVGFEYAGNVNLSSTVPCAPCWLRTPCPHDKMCLRLIDPSLVEKALHSLAGQQSRCA